jgi:hypothetical protein
MTELGYALPSQGHAPGELVRNAAHAEEAASHELPYPEHFEQAGFTHVYLHQIGQDQDGFFEFAERELIAR